MSDKIILEATFNPAVKQYWLITLLVVSVLSVFGILFLLFTVPIFLFISGKALEAMSATITERKLVVKRGIFNKEEKSIPLEKITDVAMIQGPIMRMFNLYRLSFETAGQSANGALVSLIGIDEAANFRETILTQKDKVLSGMQSNNTANTTESGEANADMATLINSVKRIETLLEKLANSQ
ncbi:PH domain-containing protein [Alteromonas sp. D210916BOD_24]|uniref:PH domain-containing protein n=1 Tax=Alteromonas sp. D210916BOD_24 TaxID=3157618 RepID=UPI00399CBB78